VVIGSAGCVCVVGSTSAGGVTVVSLLFGGLYQETALLICSSVYHFLSNSEYSGNSLTLAIISVVVGAGFGKSFVVSIVGFNGIVSFCQGSGFDISILVYFETSVPACACVSYSDCVSFLPVVSV
jgi:hypothetical protein